MLDTTNSAIALYRDHKTKIFNLRTLTRFLRQYRESAEELLALPRSGSAELHTFEDRLNRALSSGFMTYTPFLRFELTVKLAVHVLSALSALGSRAVATRLEEMTKLLAVLRQQNAQIGNAERMTLA